MESVESRVGNEDRALAEAIKRSEISDENNADQLSDTGLNPVLAQVNGMTD